MGPGVFALLGRSLRIDSRSLSTHGARVALMIAIYCSLCVTLASRFSIAAPGLNFFQGIATLDAIFLTLLGISFFSTAITEEKEEDTLGLMMMAGISPLGILIGKSGGRLWQSLLLVAVQYPFMLLAITMGGVTASQVFAMTVSLLAYMALLAGYGLLCSTIAPRSRTAGLFTILGLVLYFGLPLVGKALVAAHRAGQFNWPTTWGVSEASWGLLDGLGDLCVGMRMVDILQTGFAQSAWTLQVFSNVLTGAICVGLSWLLFGVATRSPSTESNSRGLVSHRRGFLRFTAGNVWSNPFIWKDFHFVSGGIGMMLVRIGFYVGLVLVARAFDSAARVGTSRGMWVKLSLAWIAFCLTIESALVLARSMHDEVRGQTISSLLMLPHSPHRIVYSKFAGALLGWLPGPMIGLALMFGTDAGKEGFLQMVNSRESIIIVPLVIYYSLVPHFAALIALYVRWGAVPLAIGMTVGVYIIIAGCALVFLLLTNGFNRPRSPSDLIVVVTLLTGVLSTICAACHIGILLRVQHLASK